MSDFCRDEAIRLAEERGYYRPTLRNGHLVVYRDDAIDYAAEVLYPRGLVGFGHLCPDWREACRLLGMIPPAR